MTTKYILQLSSGIGEPGWTCEVHAEHDWDAIDRAGRILRTSKCAALANSAALWQGKSLRMSWRITHETQLEVDEAAIAGHQVEKSQEVSS